MGTGNLGFPGLNRDGAEEARGAHNPEVLGSSPSSGIFHFGSFTEAARGTYVPLRPLRAEGFKGALDAPSSRCSSAEERLNPRPSLLSTRNGLTEGRLSAHNGEDVGSKPTTGIHTFFREGGQSPPQTPQTPQRRRGV